MNAARELRWRLDPAQLFRDATGHTPAPWQEGFLRCKDPRVALAVSRQGGKSTLTAIKAIHAAMFHPGSLVLLAAPGQAQASELLHKCRTFYKAIGAPRGSYGDSATRLEFQNVSRVLALTGNPDSVRGYSAPRLLVVDEGARVEEELITSLKPMLAASPPGSQFVALSTPRGRQNWFFEEIFSERATGEWRTWQIPASEIDWITESFLRGERATMGREQYAEEYGAEFNTFSGGAFDPNWVAQATTPEASIWRF
jgi:hypothetical protein